MTSKLTILSIDPETAGEDVRRMQEALCLLEQLRQLLKNIGSHDLAEPAVCAARPAGSRPLHPGECPEI